MGFIDAMAFGNMTMTGVLEFGSAAILWSLTLGLLATAAGAIALSVWYPRRAPRFAPLLVLRGGGAAANLAGRPT